MGTEMKIYEHKVSYEEFDDDIKKVLERKYPEAKVTMMNENIQGKMGEEGIERTATWEGTWKERPIRLVFTAIKGEEGT